MLEDIAVLTGGTVISEDTGRTFENLDVSDLGQADKVWADKDNARIIGGKGDKKAIEARISLIKRQVSDTDSDFDKEKLEERLAKLSGGVAVIEVGAASETEMNEKQARIKNAVAATKAAIEEGIVPGGGVALLRAREALTTSMVTLKSVTKLEPEFVRREHGSLGWKIVYEALDAPIRGILANSTQNWQEIYKHVLYGSGNPSAKNGKELRAYGYDVVKQSYGPMLELGIMDPAKVVRLALQNAVSVAILILTTDVLITDIPEEKKEPAMPGGGMGGGMDY
jgi:chaperonin GroEL